MADPVVETIAQIVKQRLDALKSAGFEILASDVIRPIRETEYSPQDSLIVLVQGDEEINDELSCPGNPPAIARDQTFEIHCYIMLSEDSTVILNKRANDFHADVIKAITAVNNWHNFNGNAINARFGPCQSLDRDGGPDGLNIPLVVTYRTDENDPYTAR